MLKKVSLKTAISKLFLLIAIMLFVFIFKKLFGAENSLIGVTIITAIFMFLPYNLSVHPVKFFFRILAINIIMGLCSFIAPYNIYLGFIINFLIVFWITFNFYHSFRMEMQYPFLLQYAFILFSPIQTGAEFNLEPYIMRLLALSTAPILIIGIQKLMHKNFFDTKIKNLNCCINDLILILNGEKINLIDRISNLKLAIFDYKDNLNQANNKDKYILNIIMSIENIYNNLEDFSNEDIMALKVFLNDLKMYINHSGKMPSLPNTLINSVLYNNFYIIIENLKAFATKDSLKNLISEEKLKIKDLVTNKKNRYILEQTFSFKMAIAFSLIVFISELCNFPEGKWAAFTVLSVITPLFEKSVQKMKYRFGSTIIGLILISFIFYIIRDTNLRMLFMLIINYIYIFQTEYKYKIIFVTISAVGMIMINNPMETFDVNLIFIRFLMIFIGLIIGIICNRYIFVFTLQNSINYNIVRYSHDINLIIEDLKMLMEKHIFDKRIYTRLMLPILLQSNISKNIQECEATNKFTNPINNKAIEIVNRLYYYYMSFSYNLYNEKQKKEIFKKIAIIKNFSFDELDDFYSLLRIKEVEDYSLTDYRKYIDLLDLNLMNALNERFKFVKNIGIIKKEKGIKIIDKNRENEILNEAENFEYKEQIIEIYKQIFELNYKIEK